MSTLTSVVEKIRRTVQAGVLRDSPDRHLLDRFQGKEDEGAFAELVRRHGPMVLATCRRVLRHEQDAEDAFQAAFLVLARKSDSIREMESIAGWLFQVAHRLAVRARARENRRRHLPLLDEISAPPPANGHREILNQELERLPEPYRAALVLCYLEGRTQTEAARLLATTTYAINSRLKRARDLLRQRLVRSGFVLSAAGLIDFLSTSAGHAALPTALAKVTAQAAVTYASCGSAGGVSAAALDLAKGALHMMSSKIKVLLAMVMAGILWATSMMFSPPALGDGPEATVQACRKPAAPLETVDKPAPGKKAKSPFSVIILWMSGGPSQLDTWDPKPGNKNGGPFRAIDTTIKGVQISEHMPHLAKLAKHLAIIRTLKHREGDHMRATRLMRTGYGVDGCNYPSLGSVLAKELGEGRPDVPRFISIFPKMDFVLGVSSGGYLGPQFDPLVVPPAGNGKGFMVPDIEKFEALDKKRAAKMRQAVNKAFDLAGEKPEVKNAYGPSQFGQACLVARRLIEQNVPVVEITMGGWDTHQDNFNLVQKRSIELDFAWGALLKDLQDRKRLEKTLIVWMGEFGRTPRINANMGRDHWPRCFSVVLAGGGIKGGQVIGKTSPDGMRIMERPVSPQEFLATIYRAVGIDPAKEYRSNTDEKVPLVPEGTKTIKELLP
jgi:RNA polymerase sigma factor (sigma-70 family)